MKENIKDMPIYKNPKEDIEDRVRDLLGRMTPEEKVRQLDQYFGTGFVDKTHPHMVTVASEDASIRTDVAEREIHGPGIGCIHDLYAHPGIVNELQKHAMEETRLGIPILFSEEALHGLCRPGFTIFPQSITQASTWNETLVEAVGRGIASEVRSFGIHESFGPVIDLARDPRWGRMEETYGEDTYLASRMAVSMVKGLQGADLASDSSIIAEPKHYAGYGNPAGGLNMSPCLVGKQELFSYYMPIFEAAFVEGGALNAMCSYNSIDGIPCSADHHLLTGVLRDQWHMPGFVRSDLGAVNRLLTGHHVASTEKEAIRMALEAGVDMQYYDFSHETYQKSLLEMIGDGTLLVETLDRAVARVLRVKFRLGLFEKPYVDPDLYKSRVRCPEHIETAHQTAREGICLLKNQSGLLPLDKGIKRIAVIGPGADTAALGDYTPYVEGCVPVTVLSAVKDRVACETEVFYAKGVDFTEDMLSHIPKDYLADRAGNAGLTGEYFNNPDFEGQPVFVRTDPQIHFNWIISKPDERITEKCFSVRWTGKLCTRKDLNGRIGISSHDSMRVWVDGELVIDSWGENRTSAQSIPFQFQSGHEYDVRVEYVKDHSGVDVMLGWNLGTDGFEEAVNAAEKADIAIVVLGDSDKTCGEGIDRCELGLPGKQLELLKAVHATGTPVALVLQNGRAMALPWEADHIPAIVEAWYAGEQGGKAIAEVLFGDVNPSGKLPVSFPKSVGRLPCYYNQRRGGNTLYIEGDNKPLFPFGHGLSYTSFTYSNLRLSSDRIEASGELTVLFDVANTGGRAGQEVVQLYVCDAVSSVVRPLKELKKFKKISLEAGEKRSLSFTLTWQDLKLLDRNLQWVVEPGQFKVMVGSSSEKIELTESFHVY